MTTYMITVIAITALLTAICVGYVAGQRCLAKAKLADVRVLRIQWRAAGRFNNPSTRVVYTTQGSGDVVTRDFWGVNLSEHDIRWIMGWPYYTVTLPEIETDATEDVQL